MMIRFYLSPNETDSTVTASDASTCDLPCGLAITFSIIFFLAIVVLLGIICLRIWRDRRGNDVELALYSVYSGLPESLMDEDVADTQSGPRERSLLVSRARSPGDVAPTPSSGFTAVSLNAADLPSDIIVLPAPVVVSSSEDVDEEEDEYDASEELDEDDEDAARSSQQELRARLQTRPSWSGAVHTNYALRLRHYPESDD
jgi:hypothetical protein